MKTLKIALTGGIACGKSSVIQIFKKNAIAIIDLDVIAREVVEPNTQALSELVAHFGNGILNDDQSLIEKRCAKCYLKITLIRK